MVYTGKILQKTIKIVFVFAAFGAKAARQIVTTNDAAYI